MLCHPGGDWSPVYPHLVDGFIIEKHVNNVNYTLHGLKGYAKTKRKVDEKKRRLLLESLSKHSLRLVTSRPLP